MAFGGQHIKPTRLNHLRLLGGMFRLDALAHFIRVQMRVGSNRLHHRHFHIAAQLNIGATARHVGGDRYGTKLACIGHNLGLLFVLARIQHIVRHTRIFQQTRQKFRFLNRGRANQQRLPLGIGIFNFVHDAQVFFLGRAVHFVMFIFPRNRAVGRHFNHAKPVNLHKLISFGQCRAGHTAQLFIKPEIILKRNRGQRYVFRLDSHVFLGLNRLVQPV